MCRNFAEARSFVVMLALAALAGCSSAPELPTTAEATQSRASTEQKPAADASAANAQGATPPGAAPEAPLPPEAVQQFDQAVLRMNAGDLAAAEQGFRSLAAAYPSYSGALLNLGILQAKTNRLDEAEKTLRSAVERNGANAAAFNQLGIVYRKLGRFKEADEAYQRAVQADPNYALAWLNLGVLCDLYLQQPQRALEAFERYLAVASSPDAKVAGWVTELKKRVGAAAEPSAAARAE